tara:strand:+ start:705 stop:1226 length:522 start_codon:yes stop_codon:yes gene_type:complete
MTQLLSSQGIDISQKNFQQIIIRGDGKDQFNEKINQEISTFPPSKNLEVTTNDKFIFAKNSFDQWSLIYLVEQDYKEILKFISKINSNDEILASDYSYGQVYFEISGENKNEFLNQLTHFDLRLKKFPAFTMAQTLIAKIDCTIYNLKDKYIVTCNKSYEDYFKERLKDSIKL